MAFAHPELLAPAIISLIAALYPLPWHLRTKNIATLSMIFWMTALNLVHIVNCSVWSDNVDIKAKGWGDISAALTVGYNYGLPLAHLILAKQLESLTSLRPRSALFDVKARQRHRIFDLSISIIGPAVGILVHLSMMDRRFYIIEGFGPMPATYWNTWGVIAMAIVPILIAFACAVYTIMAIVNVHLRRQQLLSLIHSDATINRDQFIRLLFLAIAELGTCALRAVFNLVSFQNGPQPMAHRGPPFRNLSIIETLTSDQLSSTGLLVLRLQFYTVFACSVVFLLCFATGAETKTFYMKVVRRIMPCLPEPRSERQNKLSSFDSGASRSQTGHLPYSPSSRSEGPITPTTGKEDISLEEMLGSPATPNLKQPSKWGPKEPIYDAEAGEAVYLAPIEEK